MVTLLAFALQLQLGLGAGGRETERAPEDDSLRDVRRAHAVQAAFERGRRYVLPWGAGSSGRCDVRVGRFCWWYEEGASTLPPEPTEIRRRRQELLSELDVLGRRRPGDAWIAGMRVYYRLENRETALADSAAQECHAEGWWCTALRGYAAEGRTDIVAADSAFNVAMAAMPDSVRCVWRDISALLPRGVRERYEQMKCTDRMPVENRYWMLSTPRLSNAANEWHTEFLARRVLVTLLASAITPHRIEWGLDTEELLLRYGWPIAWSRIPSTSMAALEPEILGHDPAPSFHYGPHQELLDTAATAARNDAWDLTNVHAPSRYAHPGIRRIASLTTQMARFRRGDSTLLVAAWATDDDSVRVPAVTLGATLGDGRIMAIAADSARTGRARLIVPGVPRMSGVELMDSVSGSLARSRSIFAPSRNSGTVLSDLLIYRVSAPDVTTLDAVLAQAIPGDGASAAVPLGLYWEAYGVDSAGSRAETSVNVERIDRGLFRTARQRLGLADPDSPIRVRWSEVARPHTSIISRTLSLDLSSLPAGRYRITVTLTPVIGPGSSTSTDIDLHGK